MYYGVTLDLQEKPTVACNRTWQSVCACCVLLWLALNAALLWIWSSVAVSWANKAIASAGASATDKTAPSIWAPQRLPYNPGGYGAGSLWGYKYTPMNTSFHVWTFVFDYSGVASVNFMYREDADGENPLKDHANEVRLRWGWRVLCWGGIHGDRLCCCCGGAAGRRCTSQRRSATVAWGRGRRWP